MSFHPPSIFRQASEPPLDSLSLDYSNDTAESSCGGIETWISDKRSSPEILWEDQSMRLFRFRQSKRDKSQKVTKPTKTGSNCPPRMSMSAETYKRQQPFLSTSADSSNLDGRPKSKDDSKQSSSRSSTLSRKHQSVSLELATAWMQMGEKNRQSTSNMSVSESTSYSSSSCGSSHDPAGYTRNTHHEEENKTKSPNSVNLPNAMSHPGDEQGEDAAYPRRSRSSLFVSDSNRLLCQQRTIRDSESTSVRALRSGHSSSRDWVHSGKTETRGSTGPGTTRDGNNSNIKNNVIGSFSSARQRDAKSSSVFGNAKTSAKEVPCNIPKPSRPTNAPKGRGIFRLNAREGSTHQERSKRRASKERGEDSRRIIMTAKSMWRTAVDPASGRTYYYHVETRETQWRKPLELASDEEKEEMRKKEELQRSFFAAMEANILKNLETGATVESAQAASEKERTKNFLQTRSVEGTQIERPGLVRTISSMDRQIISELVKRQPSNRRLFDDHATSPNDVIAAKFRESTVASDALTDQTKNLSLEEYPGEMPLNGGFNRAMSEESMQRQASLGTILSNLPDDNTSSRLGNSYLSSIAGASFYDESADDFGVSDEEIDALTELAKISDRMSSIQDDGQLETTEDTSRFAPTGLRSSIKRASMTNNSLSVLREENEFSEHSTGNDSPRKDERAKMERERVFENMKDAGFDEDFEKPNMVRRNTCGTIYVGSTMSAPDKDATMKVRTIDVSWNKQKTECRSHVAFRYLSSAYAVCTEPIFCSPKRKICQR